jgi:hypothetical protein
MSAIHERRFAQLPLGLASEYLGNYIRDIETEGAGQIVLSVKVPLERVGFDRRVEVSKAVCVRFAPTIFQPPSPGHLTAISWEPAGGGPFPKFNGTIGLAADEKPDACCITLDGHYDPPLGPIGDAFDAVIGKHIARLTARNLLDEIAIVMELAYSQSLESSE